MTAHVFDKSASLFGVKPSMYLDASDVNYRVLNGSNVSAALDKMGGSNFTQPTAGNQLFLVEGAQNGLDVWTGNATSFRYLTGNVPFPDAFTLFLVADREVSYPPTYLFSGSGWADAPAIISNSNPGSGVKAFEWYEPGFRQTISADATGWHVIAVTHDADDGSRMKAYFDGVEVFDAVSPPIAGRYIDQIFISLSHTENQLGQLEMLPKVFSVLEIGLHTRYLKNKWGIS